MHALTVSGFPTSSRLLSVVSCVRVRRVEGRLERWLWLRSRERRDFLELCVQWDACRTYIHSDNCQGEEYVYALLAIAIAYILCC